MRYVGRRGEKNGFSWTQCGHRLVGSLFEYSTGYEKVSRDETVSKAARNVTANVGEKFNAGVLSTERNAERPSLSPFFV